MSFILIFTVTCRSYLPTLRFLKVFTHGAKPLVKTGEGNSVSVLLKTKQKLLMLLFFAT